MKSENICTRCIMDTSDPEIYFDEEGVCNHCHSYDEKNELFGYRGEESERILEKIVFKIKEEGKGKKYDCILGISGGVDSSYLAYLSHKLGLRPLLVHVDAGWNSPLAVENINKICKKLGWEVQKITVDWVTIKELQRAFMYSDLPNLDIPQDHCFLAGVYKCAQENGIKYMLNGSNLATEGILPQSWGYAAIDYKHIKGVYKEHGRGMDLKKYPHFGILEYLKMQQTTKRINLLNCVEYSLSGAIDFLQKEFEWQYYGAKHFESRFTKYFQGVYLPEKFGYNKKRAHLSSLVVSNEISRDEALKKMEETSSYNLEEQRVDRDYILKELEIPIEDWEKILKRPNKTEKDYPSNAKLISFLTTVKRKLK